LLFAQQPRDARMEIGGASTISGVIVTDDQNPQPLQRVRVELSGEGQFNRSVSTDTRGTFVFRGLSAGRYFVAAMKPAYVRTAYGAQRPGRPGTPITIADGQQVANLQIRLPRGSVITGVIRDELGQPAQGVGVRVMQYRNQNGERVLSLPPLADGFLDKITDDRGMYRIFGLPAGEYIVVATPRSLGTGDVRQTTPAEIQAMQQVVPSQAAAAPPAATVTYAPVYYPDTSAAANAVPVVVAAGEERTGVDLSLQLVRTARVEGIVTAIGASPQDADVLMLPTGITTMGPPMLALNRARPDAEGRFSYSGIAPGKYTITARMAANQLWATAEVTVDGENVSGVALDLQPGLTISGRIVLEGTPAARPDLSAVRVSLTPGSSGMMLVGLKDNTEGSVDAQGRFTLTNVVPGKYRLDAQIGANWTLKSAVINGRDTLDFPADVGPNDKAGDAVLTFTDQTQEVTGTLQDAAGRPAPDFTIVVFPADKAFWSATRRIRTSRPGTDGRFVVRGLPAGEYRIAALVDLAPGEANDPAVLADLVPASVTFSLREGERKVQDLRMAGER
jgi:5-hydroxyisourate hydrolase-like protein (transthyretin family)